MARKYLITGGTGFIGAALTRRLVERGDAVRVLDNDSRGKSARLAGLDVELVEADIREPDAVSAAVEGVDAVVHLASVNGTRNFYEKPNVVLEVGVRGILNVVEACSTHGVEGLFVVSSSEVYQTPPLIPTGESVPLSIPDPLNPRYSYAGAKIISELVAMHCSSSIERAVVFRPHNVYGPDMGYDHVIPAFVRRALEKLRELPSDEAVPFEIEGDGEQTRAFIFIDDFTDGLVKVLDQGEHRNIYHIGTDVESRIADVADTVFSILERDYVLVPGSRPAGGTDRRCPDISKLRKLGFEPKVSLREGIQKMVDWQRRQLNETRNP